MVTRAANLQIRDLRGPSNKNACQSRVLENRSEYVHP